MASSQKVSFPEREASSDSDALDRKAHIRNRIIGIVGVVGGILVGVRRRAIGRRDMMRRMELLYRMMYGEQLRIMARGMDITRRGSEMKGKCCSC